MPKPSRKPSRIAVLLLGGTLLAAAQAGLAGEPKPAISTFPKQGGDNRMVDAAIAAAEAQLHQTFSNLGVTDFGPAPVRGPIYQAMAGGQMLYYAPESQNLIFGAIYDKDGLNLTALAQEEIARQKFAAIDLTKALEIGPKDAPEIVEFSDPDCPYCRALQTWFQAKAAEGKQVRRRIFFVSLHPESAAKAEHILCSKDMAAELAKLYAGVRPEKLITCADGAERVKADAAIAKDAGVSGTPTLFVNGAPVIGFKQDVLEAWLMPPAKPPEAK